MTCSIKKLKTPQNLTTQAYDSIKAYILRDDFEESTRLTEEFLSSQLGISKSPVREALNSLHTEGLIRIEARRGAYLRSFSLKEVKDLYELREALEVFAVGACQITPNLIEELRQSVRRTSSDLHASDRTAHIAEDTHFHMLIARSTGNTELCRILENIQSQLWICRRQTYSLTSSTAPDAHLEITNALAAGKRASAQKSMRNHISLVRKCLLDFMETNE
jgi:DNA-binding GntR family transcriptional regulator